MQEDGNFPASFSIILTIMNRSFLRFSAVLFAATLALAASCSKASKTDSSEASSTAPPVNDGAKPKDLEAEIAKPGAKTITAVSANGEKKVLTAGGNVLAETKTYIVKAEVPEASSSGEKADVKITLLPKTGWHINQDFPTKLKITAPEGIALASDTQRATDAEKFSEDAALFNVSCNPEGAGAKAFTAEFRFAMCTESTCDPKKAALAWTLNVK